MEKIKLCIVGAGNIAQSAHLPVYQQRDDVEITGIADLNLERAQEAAKKFGIPKAFSSVEEMLENVECDYVDICVWNRAGRHRRRPRGQAHSVRKADGFEP